MSIRIELGMPEQMLLEEISDKRMKREDVALTYVLAMRSGETVDWGRVNRAIIDRWSLSALKWIKTYAWRRLREAASDQEEESG